MRDILFQKTGAAISESDIIALETKIGKRLPSDYREFLLQFNGGTKPKYSVFQFEKSNRFSSSIINELYSIKSETSFALEKRFLNEYIEPIYIQIGHDVAGNGICLCMSENEFGAIYWHSEDQEAPDDEDAYEPVLFISRSFSDFINSLEMMEAPPTDEFDVMAESGSHSDLMRFLGKGNDIDKLSPYGRTLAQQCTRHDDVELLEK